MDHNFRAFLAMATLGESTGLVTFPSRTSGKATDIHPSILLAISCLRKSSLGRLTPSSAAGNRSEVCVPVGLLSRLRIGDIWQDDWLISQDEAPQTTFQNLTVNSQTSRLVKAGIELKGRWFMLPAREHPGHMQHTQSHCMLIRLGEEKQVVIPCTELARFYFGSSTWLLEKLFLPPLDPRTLFLTADFKPEGGPLHLKLSFQVSGFSASDIGRIARDKSARRAATQIGESLLTNTTQKEKAYPKALFPFVGTTDLSVKGQWLPLSRKPEMTCLVHSIQSCTHAFPFQKLTYQLDRLQDGPAMRARQPKKQTNPSPLTHSKVVSATSSIANKDPSARMSPSMWFENQGIKFPDLITNEVFRIRRLKIQPFQRAELFDLRRGDRSLLRWVAPRAHTNQCTRCQSKLRPQRTTGVLLRNSFATSCKSSRKSQTFTFSSLLKVTLMVRACRSTRYRGTTERSADSYTFRIKRLSAYGGRVLLHYRRTTTKRSGHWF